MREVDTWRGLGYIHGREVELIHQLPKPEVLPRWRKESYFIRGI